MTDNWYVIYGTHDIVLAGPVTERMAKDTAFMWNTIQPKYNHRAVSESELASSKRKRTSV